MFLTRADVERMTGRKRFAAQRRILGARGVPFVQALTGEPLVRSDREDADRWCTPGQAELLPQDKDTLRWIIESERRHPVGLVYVIDEGLDRSPIKIGTCREADESIKRRLAVLQIGNHRRLRVRRTFRGNHDMEQLAHRLFHDERLTGEWFTCSYRVAALLACGSRSLSECLLAALRAKAPE